MSARVSPSVLRATRLGLFRCSGDSDAIDPSLACLSFDDRQQMSAWRDDISGPAINDHLHASADSMNE